MAMRAIRGILHQRLGTMDFHEMMTLFGSQSTEEIHGGEMEAFLRLKDILGRKDDGKLEEDMKELDTFKELLATEFDDIIGKLKIGLAG